MAEIFKFPDPAPITMDEIAGHWETLRSLVEVTLLLNNFDSKSAKLQSSNIVKSARLNYAEQLLSGKMRTPEYVAAVGLEAIKEARIAANMPGTKPVLTLVQCLASS